MDSMSIDVRKMFIVTSAKWFVMFTCYHLLPQRMLPASCFFFFPPDLVAAPSALLYDGHHLRQRLSGDAER